MDLVSYIEPESMIFEVRNSQNRKMLWAENYSDFWYIEMGGYWYETSDDDTLYDMIASMMSGKKPFEIIRDLDPGCIEPYPKKCECCGTIVGYKY